MSKKEQFIRILWGKIKKLLIELPDDEEVRLYDDGMIMTEDEGIPIGTVRNWFNRDPKRLRKISDALGKGIQLDEDDDDEFEDEFAEKGNADLKELLEETRPNGAEDFQKEIDSLPVAEPKRTIQKKKKSRRKKGKKKKEKAPEENEQTEQSNEDKSSGDDNGGSSYNPSTGEWE